jgi:hypothetical protein
MLIKSVNFGEIVKNHLDHYRSHDINSEQGLPYLRDRLFISVLLITIPICCLVYIPSVVVSFMTGQMVLVLFNTLGMAALLFIYLGLKGPSVVMLLCISVMITLFQSKKTGLRAVVLNAIIFLSLMMVFPIKSAKLSFFQEFTPASWIAVGLNLVAFNTLVVLAVASLVDQ